MYIYFWEPSVHTANAVLLRDWDYVFYYLVFTTLLSAIL